MKSAFQTFSTYLWSTGNAWTDLRLLAEGAVSLYENECASLASLAAKEEKTETVLAFDTIGTALYDLRKRIADMQEGHLQETIRQSNDRKSE